MLQPCGHILYWPPGVNGYASAFGHAHDWYPDEKWARWDCEWIEPIRAIGPRPDLRPQATSLSQFSLTSGWNNKFRDVTLSGNPAVAAVQYYDGAVYPASSAIEEHTGGLVTTDDRSPNWVLHMVRNAPPPSQGIHTLIIISMDATHSTLGDAQVNIAIPLADDQYAHPFVHWVAPTPDGAYNIFAVGTIAQQFSGTLGAKQGGHRDIIVCQVEQLYRDETTGRIYADAGEGRTFLGAYVLLRGGENLEQWTSWYTSDLQFATAPIRVSVAGAVQSFTLTPLVYGGPQTEPAEAHCEPPDAFEVPTAANGTWSTAGHWRYLPSNATGWTLSVAESERGRKPSVTFERTDWAARHVRPLLWRASIDCPATISTTSSTGYPQDTREGHLLQSLSVTLNRDYKGATGTAVIRPQWPAPLEDWAENGIVSVALGLEGGTGLWAEQTVLTGRILPDGISPSRSGSDQGRPALTVTFGDLAAGVLANKVLLDWPNVAGKRLICTAADPCSGWETGYCWLHALANRMGLAYSQVVHDSGSIGGIIPVHLCPSTPTLQTPDGTGYLEHIRTVEAACGIRVRFDYSGDGKLSIDTGPPAYEHGVSNIIFVLDEDETDIWAMVTAIQADRGGARWSNAAKFTLKTSRQTKGEPEEQSYYWLDPADQRLATVVDDWWAFYGDDNSSSFAQLWRRYQEERHRWNAAIRWTMPLCPGLRPDHFVQLNVSAAGLPYGSIYQIVEHTMNADVDAGTAQSTLTATLVYPQTEGPY